MGRLEEIKKRRQKITAAPWVTAIDGNGKLAGVMSDPEKALHDTDIFSVSYRDIESMKDDFEFIAQAPEDIDYLISLIEENKITESKQVEKKVSKKITLPMKADEEFLNLDNVWNHFAKKIFDDNGKIIVERALNGQRAMIHRDGDTVKIIAEDGIDLTDGLSDVVVSVKALKTPRFIVDAILTVIDEADLPAKQQDFSDIDSLAKQTVRGYATDILLDDEVDMTKETLTKRKEALKKLIKKSTNLDLMPFSVASNRKELEQQTTREAKQVGSSGSMLKDSNSQYEIGTTADSWAMLKKSLIFDVRMIGFAKIPLPPPERRKFKSEEMMKLLPDLLKGSQTFIYRTSVLGRENEEVAVEENRELTADDLRISWDEDSQTWQGFDDPGLWTMSSAVPNRKAGELAFGVTVGSSLNPAPKIGQIMQIQAANVEEFDANHFAWTFAVPDRVKEAKQNPDSIIPFVKETEQEEKESTVKESKTTKLRIAKADRNYKYILGVVLVPGEVDLQNEVVSEEQIRQAESEWSGKLGEDHEVLNEGLILEKSIVLDEAKTFKNIRGEKITYPKGTWLIRVRIDDKEIWQRIMSGDLEGLSIEGFADRIKVNSETE